MAEYVCTSLSVLVFYVLGAIRVRSIKSKRRGMGGITASTIQSDLNYTALVEGEGAGPARQEEPGRGGAGQFYSSHLWSCIFFSAVALASWAALWPGFLKDPPGLYSLGLRILIVCQSVAWVLSAVFLYKLYARYPGVRPSFGFLGAWWLFQCLFLPFFFWWDHLLVWGIGEEESFVVSMAIIGCVFSPFALFVVSFSVGFDKADRSADAGGKSGNTTSARRLWKLTANHRGWLIGGCVALLIRLPFSLSIPHFVSQVIGGLIESPPAYEQVKWSIVQLFVAGSVDSFLDFWCVYLFGVAQQKIIKGLRCDVFKALLAQDVEFYDKTKTGEMTSRLTADCAEMANDLTWVFRFFIEALVRITGIMVYMVYRSWQLSLLALSIIPVTSLINVFYGRWMWKNQSQIQSAIARANAVAQEVLGAVRTVFSFAREKEEYGRYESRLTVWYELMIRQLFIQGVYYGMCNTFLINTCVQGSLLIYGSWLSYKDILEPEVLLAFMLYQGQLQEYFQNLFNSYTNLIKSFGAGTKIFEYLDREPKCKRPNKPFRRNTLGSNRLGDILFRQVSFSYPSRPEAKVLQNFNMRVKEGEVVALVGPSGAGKSTVFHLLEHFYDPDEGEIFVGGRLLKEYDHGALHKDFALVGQEPTLMSGTIEDNILYGVIGMDVLDDSEKAEWRENVVRCAKQANAHDFIVNLPDGYQTDVGENGVQLSGGQKQRVAIARCLIQNPAVLLLDEATSALDAESEAAVQEALDVAMKDRTTFVIAHRLSTVSKADRIYVLENGKIVEDGSHADLINRPLPTDHSYTSYRQLVERQSGF